MEYSYTVEGQRYSGHPAASSFGSESEAADLLSSLRELPPPARYQPGMPSVGLEPSRDAALGLSVQATANTALRYAGPDSDGDWVSGQLPQSWSSWTHRRRCGRETLLAQGCETARYRKSRASPAPSATSPRCFPETVRRTRRRRRRWPRAIPPAVRQRLAGVHHLLAFLAPPVDDEFAFVGDPDFFDPGRRRPTSAPQREMSVAHSRIIYKLLIAPKRGPNTAPNRT